MFRMHAKPGGKRPQTENGVKRGAPQKPTRGLTHCRRSASRQNANCGRSKTGHHLARRVDAPPPAWKHPDGKSATPHARRRRFPTTDPVIIGSCLRKNGAAGSARNEQAACDGSMLKRECQRCGEQRCAAYRRKLSHAKAAEIGNHTPDSHRYETA